MYDFVRILLIWFFCFLSVLLHELGHALGYRISGGKAEWKIRAGFPAEEASVIPRKHKCRKTRIRAVAEKVTAFFHPGFLQNRPLSESVRASCSRTADPESFRSPAIPAARISPAGQSYPGNPAPVPAG